MDQDNRAAAAAPRASRPRGDGARLPRALAAALTAAAILALSLGITWPLWSMATSSRGAYNALFAVAVLAAAVGFLASRAAGRPRRPRRAGKR